MKHLVNRLLAGFSVVLLMASCSTDDYEPSVGNSELWQGELSEAPFAKDAICLAITDAMLDGKAVNYIELTSSGLYYITFIGNNSYQRPASFRKPQALTRDWLPVESVLDGAYTVIGENHYDLEGFGEMTINPDGTVDLKLTEGETYVWPFTKLEKIAGTPLNSRLCRTWLLIDGHIDFLDAKMNVVCTLPISSSVMAEDYIYAITFTTAGRAYRKDYPSDPWYGANWRWSDASAQLVHLESDDASDGEGIFQVLFDDNRMLVMNPSMFENGEEARWEFANIPGYEDIPYETRYAREYINLKAMN